MTRTYVVVLTQGEIDIVRASTAIAVETDTDLPPATRAAAERAIAKIDAAAALTDDQWLAVDRAFTNRLAGLEGQPDERRLLGGAMGRLRHVIGAAAARHVARRRKVKP